MLTCFLLVMLSIVAILLIRNVIKYVIRLKRYKEFHIGLFYLLAVLIVGLRITGHILVLVMNSDEDTQAKLLYPTWVIWYSCRCVENMLGVQ